MASSTARDTPQTLSIPEKAKRSQSVWRAPGRLQIRNTMRQRPASSGLPRAAGAKLLSPLASPKAGAGTGAGVRVTEKRAERHAVTSFGHRALRLMQRVRQHLLELQDGRDASGHEQLRPVVSAALSEASSEWTQRLLLTAKPSRSSSALPEAVLDRRERDCDRSAAVQPITRPAAREKGLSRRVLMALRRRRQEGRHHRQHPLGHAQVKPPTVAGALTRLTATDRHRRRERAARQISDRERVEAPGRRRNERSSSALPPSRNSQDHDRRT